NGGLRPELPSGYDFDYINTDVLLNRMSVSNNKLVLPDGLNYSVLVLPESREMSLPVLKKVKAFLEAGAVVVGPKPLKSVGLTHYPHSEKEFHELCTQIWADLDGSSRTQRAYGQGRIFWGMPLKEVLRLNSVPADVEIGRPVEEISWIHRT